MNNKHYANGATISKRIDILKGIHAWQNSDLNVYKVRNKMKIISKIKHSF